MSRRNSDRPPQGELPGNKAQQAAEGTQSAETPPALERQVGDADGQADSANTQSGSSEAQAGDAGEQADSPPPPPPSEGEGERKIAARARHKTPHPRYRIAGLALTQAMQTYEVTQAQLEAMRRDPWVALEE